MNTKEISEALSKLIIWLQSWKKKDGAYNGYVVHRFDLKRMFRTHDTPWSQGPIIKGYLNIYKATRNRIWLNEAIQAADLQCNRLSSDGSYTNAGFEDDRFSSLVHNSIANCALLDLISVLEEEHDTNKSKKYLEIVKTNVDNYLISILFDKTFGAFRFSKIDYYSPNVTRFVVNMNSVAAESLIKLYYLTKEIKYRDIAMRIGEWMLTEQISSDNYEDGGINYSQVQPRVLITIYTALAMRGLDDLYLLTLDERYLEMMKKSAKHLINLIDEESGLFYHAILKGNIIKYPQYIGGSGIILNALYDTEKIANKEIDLNKTAECLMKKQLPNGGFPNFIGYRYNKQERRVVWEDIIPVTGWNAHIFEFLSRFVERDFCIKRNEKRNLNLGNNFLYFESRKIVCLISIWPIQSFLIYFLIKRMDIALIYISANQIAKLITPTIMKIKSKRGIIP